LKSGIVNSGEVAGARRLVLLRAKGEGVDVDTLIRVSGVGLVRLDPREVRTFTLREAVLAVKLELSGDDRVLAPAVHVKRGLREDECTSIRDTRVIVVGTIVVAITGNIGATKVDLVVRVGRTMPVSSSSTNNINSTSVLEETLGINVCARILSNGSRTSESMDSVRKSINGISVVEGLSTEDLEKESIASQGRAVINVLIRLDNPDELLNGVVKVELDLVTGRTNRLITSELELSDQVLMRVLGHSAALISVKEDVVNVQRGGNQRLIVGNGGRDRAASSVLESRTTVRISVAIQGGNSPQALINRSDIKVDLDFVVLESNKGKGKTRVGAEPELKRNIKGSLRKSVTGSANLTRS
jgi:hypothetical protein